jgi:hypothetical protein
MRFAPVGRSAIIIARPILTALVLAVVAPGSADASCSHYVQTNSDVPNYELSRALVDNADFPRDTTETLAPLGHERRRPCSGALCSGRPASPSSPTQIDLPRAGQWAIVAAPVQVDVPEPEFSPHDESVLLSRHRRTSVYHPPRRSRCLRAL